MASSETPEPLSFPVETEIIIQSDGRVIVADLPFELANLVSELQGNGAETQELHPDAERTGSVADDASLVDTEPRRND